MADSGSGRQQKFIPMLAYADAEAALEFLCVAFGFEETMRLEMPDGRIGHAEVALGDHIVMLASAYPEMGFQSPLKLGAVPSQLMCWIDDVDAHHARARAAGAVIAVPPMDQDHGARVYRAIDLEGHRWIFASGGHADTGDGNSEDG